MKQWVQNFAFHTEIHWLVYIFAGLATVVFAMATISVLILKAAIANPIQRLKNE